MGDPHCGFGWWLPRLVAWCVPWTTDCRFRSIRHVFGIRYAYGLHYCLGRWGRCNHRGRIADTRRSTRPGSGNVRERLSFQYRCWWMRDNQHDRPIDDVARVGWHGNGIGYPPGARMRHRR